MQNGKTHDSSAQIKTSLRLPQMHLTLSPLTFQEHSGSRSPTLRDFKCWDQSPFTEGGSSDLTGALPSSLHISHSHRQDFLSSSIPGFPSQGLRPLVPLSNFILVQQQRNSSSLCLGEGTLNKGNIGLLYPEAGVFHLSPQLLLCL